MANKRTLLQILTTLKANLRGFTKVGSRNQAHDDFLKQLPNASKSEKEEALEFLEKQDELDYSGTGIDLEELKLSLGWIKKN